MRVNSGPSGFTCGSLTVNPVVEPFPSSQGVKDARLTLIPKTNGGSEMAKP